MPRWCEERRMEDGSVMILCHSGNIPKPEKCDYCDRPHISLCDWIIEYGLENPTCDKKLCKIHAMKPIPEFGNPHQDIDYCPEHYALYKKNLMEVKKIGN